MTIDILVKAIPPPVAPFEAFRGPWEPIEAAIGTALPQDYKDFVRLYGSGYWMQFFGICIPRSRNPNVQLEVQVPLMCGMFPDREELPYPLWPEPNGLIPFGATDNGDVLFWLARGDPQDWGVVVWDRGFQTFEAFDCDLTGFLAGLATREILPKEFPEDLLPNVSLFSPHSSEPNRRRLRLIPADAGDAILSISWRMGGYGTGYGGVAKCRLRED